MLLFLSHLSHSLSSPLFLECCSLPSEYQRMRCSLSSSIRWRMCPIHYSEDSFQPPVVLSIHQSYLSHLLVLSSVLKMTPSCSDQSLKGRFIPFFPLFVVLDSHSFFESLWLCSLNSKTDYWTLCGIPNGQYRIPCLLCCIPSFLCLLFFGSRTFSLYLFEPKPICGLISTTKNLSLGFRIFCCFFFPIFFGFSILFSFF